MCAEMAYFAEPAGRIALKKLAKKIGGLLANDAVVSDALRSVEIFFDGTENLLDKRNYIAGKDFSHAGTEILSSVAKL
jgi:glutathione S-transferase